MSQILSQWHLPQGITAIRVIAGSVAIAFSSIITKRIPSQIAHRLQLNTVEWQGILQLLFIGLIALPLLPNQGMGPWETIHPRTLGVLILLIAGISLVGHFAMRLFGNRVGLLATAAIGGLVSSTAVTLSFAQQARKTPQNAPLLAAGISLAAAIMAIRVLFEVAIINRELLPLLIPSFACLALIPFIAALAISLRINLPSQPPAPELDNPVDLGSAVFFGGVLALLFILVRATETWFGETGVYVLAAISGLTDVDALSLSLAESTQRTLPLTVGALGISIGAAINTLVKGIMAITIGGLSLGQWCASILFTALSLGAIALGATLWLH